MLMLIDPISIRRYPRHSYTPLQTTSATQPLLLVSTIHSTNSPLPLTPNQLPLRIAQRPHPTQRNHKFTGIRDTGVIIIIPIRIGVGISVVGVVVIVIVAAMQPNATYEPPKRIPTFRSARIPISPTAVSTVASRSTVSR